MRSLIFAALAATTSFVRGTPAPDYARITGIALDSLHNEPLVNARITVSGSLRAAVTDELGHFSIDSIVPGKYTIAAAHPVADSLGIALRASAVDLSAGDNRVVFAIPAAATIRRLICGDTSSAAGIVRGRIVSSEKNEAITGASIQLTWFSLETAANKFALTPGIAVARSDDRGYYTFCGLPNDLDASIQAFRGGDSTGLIPLSLLSSPYAILAQPLMLAPHDREVSSIVGRVTDAASKASAGATVDIVGTAMSTRTASDGSFRIASAPAGTHMLRVRKLGYLPVTERVDIGAQESIELKLSEPTTQLETVVVKARLSEVASRTGFATRALVGAGRYVTGVQLVQSKARCVIDGIRYSLLYLTKGPGCSLAPVSDEHFRGISSLQALLPNPPRGEATKVPVGSVSQSACMELYIDDIKEAADQDLNWLDPAEVVGVEFYSAASAPGRLGTSHCHVLLIWTLAYHGSHH
jgi:hypothetical protein